MNRSEIRATATLSLVQALRMFGMFMILPVFALYARDLPGGATPLQVGLALGAYPAVQMLLQIPFGWLSDRIGRKPVIVGGLLVFAIGGAIAGASHDIHWITVGRAVQGAGAISGAVSALLADVTRVQVRTQAMAIYGAGMGVSFILALVAGPILGGMAGVGGIFYVTSIGALLAIPLVLLGVPSVPIQIAPRGALMQALRDPQLLRLDGGILLLHATMSALFIAAPHAIEETLKIPVSHHWTVYLPVLLVSVLPVFPLIRRIERTGQLRTAFIGAIVLLVVALLLAGELHASSTGLVAGLLLFFVAFNYLEGTLPSLISRRAPAGAKGAALGIYASAQFIGGALGPPLGGWVLGHFGIGGVFALTAVLPALWLGFARGGLPAANTEARHDIESRPA